MGGSMYVQAKETSTDVSRRQRALEAADSFGEFASVRSSDGTTRTTISGPVDTQFGRRVVAKLEALRSNLDAPVEAEVLVTLESHAGVRLPTKQLVDMLTTELENYGRLINSNQTATTRALRNANAEPGTLLIQGRPTTGWLLRCPPVQGYAAEYANRIIMWLGKSEALPPNTITMQNLGQHIRSLMNTLD